MTSENFIEILNWVSLAYGAYLAWYAVWKEPSSKDKSFVGFLGKCLLSIVIFIVGISVIQAIPFMAWIMVFVGIPMFIFNKLKSFK